jgi:hypothetical protein
MLELNLMFVLPFALAISFACGYGVREWISRHRRKEARKQASKIESLTGAPPRDLIIREVHERLSRLDERISDTASKIEAFRREVQIEFFATRELVEQKFEESHLSTNGVRVLAHQTTGQRSPSSD